MLADGDDAIPTMVCTRRGDLRTRLAAFEQGVDDIMQRQVRAGASELHLTGLEQSLLYLLAAHAGQVVTRDEILDALWGAAPRVGGTISLHVPGRR